MESLGSSKIKVTVILLLLWLFPRVDSFSQTLEVKPNKFAIVKAQPTSNSKQLGDPLQPGTKVKMLGDANYYYSIQTLDGRIGYSYKGNYILVPNEERSDHSVTKDVLLARTDVLQIVVIDVEVGDATLIVCPYENGKRDVILVDTGENDSDRVIAELKKRGFGLSEKPISVFIATHYDYDHIGDVRKVVPISKIVYDHGNNNIKDYYAEVVNQAGVDRRLMTLDYLEEFSGGVTIECVAVNRSTDFDPNLGPHEYKDNPNSIALIVHYKAFDFFIGGDLTFRAEKSLAKGIKNCDVYHVNHHGSRATSSDSAFVWKLDPEVSVVSNGTKHGHPTADVAQRIIRSGSMFYQTNSNPNDPRAHNPDPKYVADDTYFEDEEDEDAEGPKGTITIIVDEAASKYYVVMDGLPLNESAFDIEHP